MGRAFCYSVWFGSLNECEKLLGSVFWFVQKLTIRCMISTNRLRNIIVLSICTKSNRSWKDLSYKLLSNCPNCPIFIYFIGAQFWFLTVSCHFRFVYTLEQVSCCRKLVIGRKWHSKSENAPKSCGTQHTQICDVVLPDGCHFFYQILVYCRPRFNSVEMVYTRYSLQYLGP